jgi:hypothetical protein
MRTRFWSNNQSVRKTPPRWTRYRWDDNCKMDLREIGYDILRWLNWFRVGSNCWTVCPLWYICGLHKNDKYLGQISKISVIAFVLIPFIFIYAFWRGHGIIYRICITWEQGYLSRYGDWLRAGRPMGRSSSPGTVKNFFFSMSSRPALGPTQLPIQWG